jgi:glutamate carboxypeptidase
VGDIFRAELDALGFTTRWIDGAPFNRAGHLVAERGNKGPKVVLIGHLDTVFEPESPFQKLTWIGDTAANGPGVLDMKGGDVIMLQALKALAAAGALDRLRITIVLDGDEELTGEPQELARQALRDAAQGADAALGFEDADGDPRHIVIARRGTSSWTLKAKGTPAHSSQIFRDDIGPGAIFEIARILDGWRSRLAGEEFLTFNPGVVLGGTLVDYDAGHSGGTAFGKDNVIAELATATGDLRTISVGQREQAKVAMQAVVDDSLAHTSAVLTFEDGYPPMAPTEGNRRLLALYDTVSQDLGFGPVSAVDPNRAGAADVSFIADLVPMIIDGLGMKGHGDHTVDEYADMASFPMQIKRAAVVLSRLAK